MPSNKLARSQTRLTEYFNGLKRDNPVFRSSLFYIRRGTKLQRRHKERFTRWTSSFTGHTRVRLKKRILQMVPGGVTSHQGSAPHWSCQPATRIFKYEQVSNLSDVTIRQKSTFPYLISSLSNYE